MISASSLPWIASLSGQTINGYEIGDCIDDGQFGLVFEATRQSTGAVFAMKVLLPNHDAFSAADFDSEGVLLRQLIKCSGVINIVDTGSTTLPMSLAVPGAVPGSGQAMTSVPIPIRYHVLAMASGNLEEITSDPGSLAKMAWPERIGLWRTAVKGVHQMHLNSVAHRDLKSSNCLIVVQGSHSEIRIGDLGRAKDFRLPPTLPTHEYLAGRGDRRFGPPECLWMQAGSEAIDFRNADLYGLGSLLVELVTGHPMTTLAVGSWQDAVVEGTRDLLSGNVRDLSVLRPQFRRVFGEIGTVLPRAIRHEGVDLIAQLCDPVPEARQPGRGRKRQIPPEPGLNWLLRRADILGRRLSVDSRRRGYRSSKNKSRSA